jgi:hypothetical protein
MMNHRLEVPMINREISKNKAFVNMNLFRILLQFVVFSFFFGFQYFFNEGLDITFLKQALLVAVLTSTAAICSLFSGFIAEKRGYHKN